MVTLKKFYFEPEELGSKKIEPIFFDAGVNLIIGERSQNIKNAKERNKMTGVGKSMLIECINFCLLKDLSKSRVVRVPESLLKEDTYLCLDLEVENEKSVTEVSIKRSRIDGAPIIIVEDGIEGEYEDEGSAKKRLEALFFEKSSIDRPSLRSMLSILIRDEDAAYNNIIYPYVKSSNFNFSDLIKPHLYLFQLDISVLDKIKAVLNKVRDAKAVIKDSRLVFKTADVDESEIKAHINDLEDKVKKLGMALSELNPTEAIQQKQANVLSLSEKLKTLIAKKTSKEMSIQQIKKLPKPEAIPLDEIRKTYSRYSESLGDLVKKSLEDVLLFKEEIERFQNDLMNERLLSLQEEVSVLNEEIDVVGKRISELNLQLGNREAVDGLHEELLMQAQQSSELQKLTYSYKQKESKEAEIKALMKEFSSLLEGIDRQLEIRRESILSFEEDLKEMHDYVSGNKACQFSIKTDEKKLEYVKFDYRVRLDGSSGVNRVKTFMYDALLLLNSFTKKNHLGFLIHDNIFSSANEDDIVQCLNYLAMAENKDSKFQYIVTVNKDQFDSGISQFSFDVATKKRAEFTREAPFFGTVYSEV